MRNKLGIGVIMAGLLLALGCGASSSPETSSAPTITGINELPLATGPMAATEADISKGLAKSATVGLPLVSTNASAFSPASSMGSCETFNVIKEGIQSAAQADQIICMVGAMNSAFAGLTNAQGNVIDIYDGDWHIFNLNMAADPGAPNKIKMRIVKDSAGSIISFTMFMCKLSGESLVQSEYTSQVIDGASLTMSAKGNFSDGSWAGSHEVSVAGTLDVNGHYTAKEIATRNVGASSGNSNWQEGTLTQTPGHFAVSGYRYGHYTDMTGGTGTASEAAYAVGEILGDTSSSIADIAMGDGAVKVDGDYTWTSSGEGDPGQWNPDPFIDAWLGDTALPVNPATASVFYSEANAGTLPTVESSAISIAFTAAETWDCSDDVSAAVDLPQAGDGGASFMQSCSPYGMGGSWINCYEEVQPSQ